MGSQNGFDPHLYVGSKLTPGAADVLVVLLRGGQRVEAPRVHDNLIRCRGNLAVAQTHVPQMAFCYP